MNPQAPVMYAEVLELRIHGSHAQAEPALNNTPQCRFGALCQSCSAKFNFRVDIYETGKADCGRCKLWRSRLYGWTWSALANGQAVFGNQR